MVAAIEDLVRADRDRPLGRCAVSQRPLLHECGPEPDPDPLHARLGGNPLHHRGQRVDRAASGGDGSADGKERASLLLAPIRLSGSVA